MVIGNIFTAVRVVEAGTLIMNIFPPTKVMLRLEEIVGHETCSIAHH